LSTTVIRNASWIVAYDAASRGHRYLTDGDVAFTGDRVAQVGGRFAGAADSELDGRGRMVMPGLVNIHSHPLSEPMNKGFLDELGSPALGMSSLYEFMPIYRPDLEGNRACARMALAELMLSGCTTVVDLSVVYEGWLDVLVESGMRAVVAPMFRSARWLTRNGSVVEYEWDEAAGRRAMDGALAFLDRATADPSGRIGGMVAPSQIDTCTPELIRASHAVAAGRGLPFQIHAAQSMVEWHELMRRHVRTAVQWLDELGVLGPRTILGHAIFLDHYGVPHAPRTGDLARLAATGTAVAHCPNVFQRRGIALRSLGGYLRAGVRVGIGTDTYPHNMLEELRTALYVSRLMTGDPFDLRTADVLDAATLGAATILGRDDIGRLAPGAKADLVMVDLAHPAMLPCRDPLKSLVYVAAERAVTDVFVDGVQTVRAGRCLTIDLAAAAAAVHEAHLRARDQVRQLHWANRSHWQIAPPVYPLDGCADAARR
jgi:cytosine/adenosine deaminase-related metal-dependent hydrolase